MKGGMKERENRQSIDASRKSNKHMRDTSYDHRGRGQNLYPLKIVCVMFTSRLTFSGKKEGGKKGRSMGNASPSGVTFVI
jgi:hypothetical protein